MYSPTVIKKPSGCAHNLRDYDATRLTFRWEDAAHNLARLSGDRINIAAEALDRHADGERAEQRAIRFLAKEKPARDFSFADLRAAANRFANVLGQLGVQRGERVATLCGRIPELYFAALGTLKAGAVYLPLFSAFGPEPLQSRLEISSARLLVTTDRLYKRKVAAIRARLPELKYVLLVREDVGEVPADTLDLSTLLAKASDRFTTVPMQPEDLALLHFTSGTTGKPKGVMHVHSAVIAHEVTARFALDLQDDDIYWCTADPGWVTGTSYGIIAPLVCGVSMIVDQEEFDAERWYSILANEEVSVWYTAPTAIRMLMKAGIDLVKKHSYPKLRFLASVGEPLNPEGVMFGMQAFDKPFHDNWWQTETGGIMVANYAAMDIRPGSMGKPIPGIEAAVIRKRADGGADVLGVGEVGELALKPGWPSMFRGYLNEDARYKKCFAGGWYLTGDLARRDVDGYYWFVGRADDVIKSSGHLISPFEVESALMTHPSVAQVGVIGVPDPIMGEAVKAFVELKAGFEPSEQLNKAIMGTARKLLGAAVAPREIAFTPSLPRTRSGKIMRRLLKARELGLPEGDLSTVESGA
ncbi:MAG TPA: acetate--CoA ligase [Steroidobacteraceae bacterium]|nr:acetate--CoA ligase [Steroidobacteraceae bacterium]